MPAIAGSDDAQGQAAPWKDFDTQHSDDRPPRPSGKGLLDGDTLDGLAVCASAVCMVHCLALPLLLAALPMLGHWLDPGESFHRIILAFAVPTSALALIGGRLRFGAGRPVLGGSSLAKTMTP